MAVKHSVLYWFSLSAEGFPLSTGAPPMKELKLLLFIASFWWCHHFSSWKGARLWGHLITNMASHKANWTPLFVVEGDSLSSLVSTEDITDHSLDGESYQVANENIINRARTWKQEKCSEADLKLNLHGPYFHWNKSFYDILFHFPFLTFSDTAGTLSLYPQNNSRWS